MVLGYLVARKQLSGAGDRGRLDGQLRAARHHRGIAYLIAFNDPPLALTGTALIIVACYVFRYGPTGIRATVALLTQIDQSWRKPRKAWAPAASRPSAA